MRLLLDTHIVIWLGTDLARVSERVQEALPEAELIGVSVVSAWEYGQKRARRPGELELSFDTLLEGIPAQRLAFDWSCGSHAEGLTRIHGDPFDRMLIAQALEGGWTLVTADREIRRYPVPTLW